MKIGKEKYHTRNQRLEAALDSNPFLIAAHRGEWRAHILQNSINAGTIAYQMGADIMELDVCQSKDGQFFGFHSTKEKDVLGRDIHLEDYTYDDIKQMAPLNGLGEPTGERLQLITDIVASLPEDMFIQLDRSWFYWDTLLDYLATLAPAIQERLILKSPFEKKWLDYLEAAAFKIMYMPILAEVEELSLFKAYENINFVGLEVLAADEDSVTFGRDFIDKIHADYQLFVQLNAIKLNDRTDLYAGYDDNRSLLDGPEHGWGVLHAAGADLIQTDWTMPLAQYRDAIQFGL